MPILLSFFHQEQSRPLAELPRMSAILFFIVMMKKKILTQCSLGHYKTYVKVIWGLWLFLAHASVLDRKPIQTKQSDDKHNISPYSHGRYSTQSGNTIILEQFQDDSARISH